MDVSELFHSGKLYLFASIFFMGATFILSFYIGKIVDLLGEIRNQGQFTSTVVSKILEIEILKNGEMPDEVIMSCTCDNCIRQILKLDKRKR